MQGFDFLIGSRFISDNGKDVPAYQKTGIKVLDVVPYFAEGIYAKDFQFCYHVNGKKLLKESGSKG